ncbi:polysaccharide deacetylase family protein [Erysipelothrix sp. HDW6C]|uniref:polysaccharide deacetylase family protein n=1 Tax=Erysipelothrix sp. HDW6C TaxID=2714930 RepID=UPI0014092A1D|nr:polysaccharide deacetylase family protein [Erysipelothrix sp. HDW6C]QIK69725.1 polysaccharide deacetylase family protein [Erysipelothrix sp. HDW6C]
MSFITLVYHELREPGTFEDQRPVTIDVADGYEDALPVPLFMLKEDFSTQMHYLVEHGFSFITLADITAYYYDKKPLPEKAIHLTFDDAFQSLRYETYPILKALGIKATLFVVKGWLSLEAQPYNPQVSRVLSFDEILAMRDVFEFANHTTHIHKRTGGTGLIQTLSAQKIHDDILSCAKIVDFPNVFAYPFGFYDANVVRILEAMNIDFAFTTQPGINDRTTPQLELHRYVIPYLMPLTTFIEIVERD